MKRVVITGMAPLCALGTSHEEVFENLCRKKQVLRKIIKDTPSREKIRGNYYVPFPELDHENDTPELKMVMSRGSKSAYAASAAAVNAVKDAGIEKCDDDTVVFVGTDSISMEEFSEQIIGFENEHRMSPMMIPVTMQSAIASWVTITLGTHGRSGVINMACASSTTAVGMGYESIRDGKTRMAVCGGTSYISDKNFTIVKGFEYLKCASSDKEGRVYLFSKERNGFLASEGAACMIVLEELGHALERNARIYAEVTGFEASSDAYSIVSMLPDGSVINRMLKKLVGDKKVDYYNAHGTATILNDEVEANVIRDVFGPKEAQPAINSTKAILGHSLGASGAIEIAVCADSIINDRVHGNLCGTVMEDLNISRDTIDIPVNRAVSCSFGFGGHNAAIMLERYRGDTDGK